MCRFKTYIVKVCIGCRNKFSPVEKQRCYWCGNVQNKVKCKQCQTQGKREQHIALYAYNDVMRAYIDLFKFSGGYHLKEVFAKEIKRVIQKQKPCIVVPIPTSVGTLGQRGFNQVEALLEGVAIHKMLRCIEYDKPSQRILKRHDRLRSKQPFIINHDIMLPAKNQKICLVDDIYTTGQTIFHATSCLRMCGFDNIVSISLAR